MKLRKILLFIIILPLTLFIDLVLYAMLKTCPSCTSFWQWVGSEGAISFPIVVGLTTWFSQLLANFKIATNSKN